LQLTIHWFCAAGDAQEPAQKEATPSGRSQQEIERSGLSVGKHALSSYARLTQLISGAAMKIKLAIAVIGLGFCVAITSKAQQSAAPVTTESQPLAQQVADYLLGPGDLLEVRVFGVSELGSLARIDGQGNLSSLPFLEKPIPAKCRDEAQVQKAIAEAYKVLINDPQVTVRLIERNSRQPALVFGAVRQPTRVPMLRNLRLNELIAVAGGVTDRAGGTIQILHTEPVMCPKSGEEKEALPLNGSDLPLKVVRIADMKGGKLDANPEIRPGDYVLVSEAEQVYITGSVVSPGAQLLTDGLTLSRVLGMAGGTRREANLSDIRIYRQKTGALNQDVLRVDYGAIKKNEEPDVLLKAFDVIEVREPGITFGGILREFLAGTFRSYPFFPRLP
jgi:polysaccharide export outer membrane protein